MQFRGYINQFSRLQPLCRWARVVPGIDFNLQSIFESREDIYWTLAGQPFDSAFRTYSTHQNIVVPSTCTQSTNHLFIQFLIGKPFFSHKCKYCVILSTRAAIAHILEITPLPSSCEISLTFLLVKKTQVYPLHQKEGVRQWLFVQILRRKKKWSYGKGLSLTGAREQMSNA